MTYSDHPQANTHRSAFTLLEVVVGLVLLATLLVSLLLATARHQRLIQLAANRRIAVVVADEILAGWFDSQTGTPLNASGPIVGRRDWSWRTYVASNQVVFGRTLPVVTLEIVQQTPAAQPNVLVSIETIYAPITNEAAR